MDARDDLLETLLRDDLARGVVEFFDQIARAAQLERPLYFLALAGSLTIPDFMAALGAPDGETTRERYQAWYEATVGASIPMTGSECWRFRCAILHQGRTSHPDGLGRVFFVEPGASTIRIRNVGFNLSGETALAIDLLQFVTAMVGHALHWLADHLEDPLVRRNLGNFIRRHPNGLPPFVQGVPVIG